MKQAFETAYGNFALLKLIINLKKYIFRKYLASLLTAISVVLLSSVRLSADNESEDVYRKDINAIGLVTDRSGSVASGFFVTPTLFVTNFHVSSELELKSGKIEMKDDRVFKVKRVVKEFQRQDLAILETEDESESMLELNADRTIREDDIVYSIGNPTDDWDDVSYFKMTKGAIKQIKDDNWFYENNDKDANRHEALVIQHTAIIHPGNSGGPLLNNKGQVVGVNTFFYDDSLNYAIHVDELIKVLKKNNIDFNKTKANDDRKETTDKKQKRERTFDEKVDRFLSNPANVILMSVVIFLGYSVFVIVLITAISIIVITSNRRRMVR